MYTSWFLLSICENYKSRWKKKINTEFFIVIYGSNKKQKQNIGNTLCSRCTAVSGVVCHMLQGKNVHHVAININFVAYRKHEEITYPFLERHNLILNTKSDSNYETQRRKIYKIKQITFCMGLASDVAKIDFAPRETRCILYVVFQVHIKISAHVIGCPVHINTWLIQLCLGCVCMRKNIEQVDI